MALNSTGDSNRISGRDFLEKNIRIDNFDGSHTINIAIPSGGNEDRPLVKAQRKELNALVATVAEATANEAYEIWQKIHAELGVASIEEMTVSQYRTAISFLQAMLEHSRETEANKTLIHLLLKNTPDGESRQKLMRYCHINFGSGRLAGLTRSQLQQALKWVDDQMIASIHPSSQREKTTPEWRKFIQQYPKEIIAIFAVGFLLGAFIF